jgi:hypothetical protein
LPYQKADENFFDKPVPKLTLYILLLDESGSMSWQDGLRTTWENLMIAAKKFAIELS